MAITADLYQIEVRNRIAATSTFYGTIDGELFSQVIVDAIIANGNVLDPAVTAEGDTGINLFTNGVTTRTRGIDIGFSYGTDLAGANVDFTAAATYTDTEVLKVRATPAEFGTAQALFDKVALADLTETAPKYLVNLGARFEWEISPRERDARAHDGGIEDERAWRTRLTLSLPTLGTVDAELVLTGQQLSARINASADGAARLVADGDAFRRQLEAAGIGLAALSIRGVDAPVSADAQAGGEKPVPSPLAHLFRAHSGDTGSRS